MEDRNNYPGAAPMADASMGMTVGRVTGLSTSGAGYGGASLSKASLQATPRNSGEIAEEVQLHHDLVSQLQDELDYLENAVAPVSQPLPPSEAKEPGFPARYTSVGSQLSEDNQRMMRALGRLRSIRAGITI